MWSLLCGLVLNYPHDNKNTIKIKILGLRVRNFKTCLVCSRDFT